MTRRRLIRPGFSLLEVVLAVALSAVVVFIVAAGIDFHLRQLTIHKTRIEESQLARAILRRMADDLRSVVVDRPIDFSSVEALAELSAGDQGGGDEAGETEEDASESSASEIIESAAVPATPGMYGTSYELQVDVSRIPRYEEFALVGDYADVGTMTTLSDVKTVGYFLLGNSASGGGGLSAGSTVSAVNIDTLGLPPTLSMQGLGRRVVDRSAARLATQSASFSYLDEQVELMAPEVQMIEFRYFDGERWLEEWNTEDEGGIPLAVEILLVMISRDQLDDPNRMPFQMTSFAELDPSQVYRLVVHLPAAETLPTDEELSEAEFADDAEEQP